MTSSNRAIGMMQGRLSAPVDHRIQFFPKHTWEQEFAAASALGIDAIEWIFEEPYADNPLWLEAGRSRIKELIKDTQVKVYNICGGYFMEHPFFRVSADERRKSLEILKQLIPFSADIGARAILIPLLDSARIETDDEFDIAVASMKQILPVAEQYDFSLAFEASLPAQTFLKFMTALDHPSARIVYDIGNSAGLGYNSREEIGTLGKFIINVHIKDRVLGGKGTPLGTGNADFGKTFAALKDVNYQGMFTFEVARGESGKEADNAKNSLAFLNSFLIQYFEEKL